jgi:hypothetical protein
MEFDQHLANADNLPNIVGLKLELLCKRLDGCGVEFHV